MYINFQQDQVHRSPIVILKKSIISDMHHRVTYMYINFQQIQVSGSVKTVLTNIFSTTNLVILKEKQLIQTCVIVKRTCI